ncbi:MAG: hypothetical protein V7L29_30950 [Nostoc sp.]|uniref:hypothetical protein n=1 Tax=Nostoc sp. TaxID=1180 RepID=UPI002FFABE59
MTFDFRLAVLALSWCIGAYQGLIPLAATTIFSVLLLVCPRLAIASDDWEIIKTSSLK